MSILRKAGLPRDFQVSLYISFEFSEFTHSYFCWAGHCIGEVRLIFCPVPPHGQKPWWSRKFLVYLRWFNIVPQGNSRRNPVTSMHILRRAKRVNGEHFGDVIPLDQLCSPTNLVLHFGKIANVHLSSANSHALTEEFWLNQYWDKELFFALYNESKAMQPS